MRKLIIRREGERLLIIRDCRVPGFVAGIFDRLPPVTLSRLREAGCRDHQYQNKNNGHDDSLAR
jgi:hypothetical protein